MSGPHRIRPRVLHSEVGSDNAAMTAVTACVTAETACVTAVITLRALMFRSPVLSEGVARRPTPRWTWTCDPRQKVCLKLVMNSSLELQSESRCRRGMCCQKYTWDKIKQFEQKQLKSANICQFIILLSIFCSKRLFFL